MEVDYNIGLSQKEVNERINNGQVNITMEPKTKSIKEIVITHAFTFFNIINVILGFLVLLSGLLNGTFFDSLKNIMFVGVAFINTIIAIVEEILAKKTIDKLNVISNNKIKVIRDKEVKLINKEEIVLDDICLYEIGNQIVTDGIIVNGNVEINESFITGESKNISKDKKDEILSGSFIVSGKCYVRVTHVGKDNYISKITNEAKYIKPTNSVIYNSFDRLVKILSFCLVPVALLFLINQLNINGFNFPNALMSMVSAVIGMIPEGLVLLTSSAMALSVIRLRRYNVLVQNLYATENLARVDVICLDKTGTLTENKMIVNKIIYKNNVDKKHILEILGNYLNALDDNSQTFNAIDEYVKKEYNYKIINTLNFSSSRKYSGVEFEEGIYYLGSPDNLLDTIDDDIKELQNEYRVLVLASSKKEFKDISSVKPLCYILIENKVKENALETFNFFKKQGINIKIISGDNNNTLETVAKRCGLTNVKSINLDKVLDEDIEKIVEDYDIFGRVKPHQKKLIIKALQKNKHFVAMTGDGVNDTLALKEADCSIAMASGSDAAKNVSQFLLLKNEINELPKIFKEGRRSINNIERSSSLLLSKTIFTILLIIACLFFNTEYFFVPIHLTLITAFTISVPSFILAMENNDDPVKENFLKRIVLKSFPSALTVVFNIVIINLFKIEFGLESDLCSTLTVFLTATTGFIFLDSICKPYTNSRRILFFILVTGFVYCSCFQYEFFSISYINQDTILVFVVLFICSMYIFDKLRNLSKWIMKKVL